MGIHYSTASFVLQSSFKKLLNEDNFTHTHPCNTKIRHKGEKSMKPIALTMCLVSANTIEGTSPFPSWLRQAYSPPDLSRRGSMKDKTSARRALVFTYPLV